MELRILQYFLMVAREKNITRAAKQLHMTQPTLSRQLMQLEDELGKPLFIRGKRKIELTDEGVLLRRRAEEILSLVNKTEQEITQSEEEMVGQIMIGTGIFSSSQTVLSQVIEEFHDEYPLVKFDIYVGNADLIKERDDQGAAITVEGAYQVLNQKNICFIPFYPELSTNTVFIWKKYTRLSPVIDRFIKKVQEYLEKSRSLYEK